MGRAREERRRHRRMTLNGRAVVFRRGDPVGRYDIANLSAGGVWVTGARDLKRGHLVHLYMDLQGAKEPMSFTASVNRVRDADQRVGLAMTFRNLSADDEDRIHDALLRTLIRERIESRMPVLIYEPRTRVRKELEAQVRSFGLPVVAVPDLMSAVQALEEGDTQFGSFVIHTAAYEPAVLEVAEFFARENQIHAVILPEPGKQATERMRKLSKLPEVSLPRVWNRESLRGVLAN